MLLHLILMSSGSAGTKSLHFVFQLLWLIFARTNLNLVIYKINCTAHTPSIFFCAKCLNLIIDNLSYNHRANQRRILYKKRCFCTVDNFFSFIRFIEELTRAVFLINNIFVYCAFKWYCAKGNFTTLCLHKRQEDVFSLASIWYAQSLLLIKTNWTGINEAQAQ